ncbi:MAG TPA: glycosyltransferase family 2 protein [Candidatus Competibacteraceae bacterium]|nr:glycosyltransferase family 2 protein [Candidatus Competibacteraceae bacterium]
MRRETITPMQEHWSRTLILIPAYNEAATIAAVIHQIRAHGIGSDVVVVDDHSSDDTAKRAAAAGVMVLPLAERLGAWGAIQTGMRYALTHGYRTVVTLDADGQHDPAAIPRLLAPLRAGTAAVAIGACPQRVSAARRLAWRYFRLLTGLTLTDITSGFRAYNHDAMTLLASNAGHLLSYQDVGVLLLLGRHRLAVCEVPVDMRPRSIGGSRIFDSWLTVLRYMLETSVLCLAHLGSRRR